MSDRPGARPVGLAVVGGLFVLALVGLLWLQARQLAGAEQARGASDGRSLHGLHEVESETLRLGEQWHAATLAETPDLNALQLQYDLWVDRLARAGAPAVRQLMDGDRSYAEALERLQDFARRADPLLGPDRPAPPGPTALAPLTPALQALAPALRAMAQNAARRVAQRADADSLARAQAHRLGVALTVALGALGLAFAWGAGRQLRQLRQRERVQDDLASQLRDAQHKAVTANEAKSRFLAQVSHDIRTPFQGLVGMLAPLRNGGLSPRQSEQLRMATDSAQHLLDLLDDVLDLSQLESGRMRLKPGPTDLRQLLQQVEAVMRPLALAKSLLLQVDVDPAVPEWIVTDARRLKQVLFNLLSNAVKFCAHGSVSLAVQALPGPTERLRFSVTDTGKGMGGDARSQLFAPRAAGPDAASDDASGAGLGLEISRQLARLMGGDIEVLSVPAEGSRFTFEVPLQRAAAVARPQDTPARAPQRPLQVLVAEDHPVNRQYMAALLEQLHHPAYFVANGRDAVQAVQDRRFDLVLMDLHMPELDGIGATLAIRALPDRAAATVPIIALTADAFKDTRDRCLIAGMNDFLTKPVNAQDLAAALRRLYGQGAADTAATPPATPPALSEAVPLVDPAALGPLRQGLGDARLAALIDDFLRLGTQTVRAMRAAVRDGQPLALRAEAHAARGTALNLGLAALAQTALALHEGAAHLPAHEVAHLVQRFETQLATTRRALADAGLPGVTPP